jgi:hypothetical protein
VLCRLRAAVGNREISDCPIDMDVIVSAKSLYMTQTGLLSSCDHRDLNIVSYLRHGDLVVSLQTIRKS